jgi:hypothetical protein
VGVKIAAESQCNAKAAAAIKPEPPPSRGVVLARAGMAIFQLAFWGSVSLLLLLIAVVATYQIATGR